MPAPDDSLTAQEAARDRDALPPTPHKLPDPGQWFAGDAERHLADRPKFCPMCGDDLQADGGISTEYWTSDVRVFMTWCGGCGWFGEVVRFDMVTILEEEH